MQSAGQLTQFSVYEQTPSPHMLSEGMALGVEEKRERGEGEGRREKRRMEKGGNKCTAVRVGELGVEAGGTVASD